MLTPEGISEIAQSILGMIDHASYELNGETTVKEIFDSSFDGGYITVYLYFEEGISGSFSNFSLITNQGTVLAVKPEIIEKPDVKGLLVRFKFQILEVL